MTEPSLAAQRDALARDIAALIDRLARGERDDAARDHLIAELLRYQLRAVEPYRKIAAQLAGIEIGKGDRAAADPSRWPAVPTDVFRFARVATHPPEQDTRVFRTSGTTAAAARGAHHVRELALYDRAARAAARHALFPDVERMRLVILAPREGELPDSSLSYMLARFCEWFGAGETTYAMADGAIDVAILERALGEAEASQEPLCLLGTSFAFVHADDALGSRRVTLPAGSRIMQTGGFKGRTREVAPAEMLAMLSARYGVPEAMVIAEYGMTELSSQMYETTLRAAVTGGTGRELASARRSLWVPGWVRATPVDPERLTPVADGEVGLLRIDDLANLDSACAIQTADLARKHGDAIELLGRARGATPRGCSLAVDAVLGG